MKNNSHEDPIPTAQKVERITGNAILADIALEELENKPPKVANPTAGMRIRSGS